MKTATLATALSLLTLAASARLPVIDESAVTVRQGANRLVEIGYTLASRDGEQADAAIVTLDILANGTSIGQVNLTNLTGDVNRLLAPGAKKICWQPRETWPDRAFDADQMKVRLTVWSTNAPPPYLVYNLETRKLDDIRYYPDAAAIPGGVTNDLYKTLRLVMRRVPAAGVTWRMGGSNSKGYFVYHNVTFTEDYWLGIYELTWRQFCIMEGKKDSFPAEQSYTQNADDRAPAHGLQYHGWRGSPSGGSDWPDGGFADAKGYIADIRSRTKLYFDLPTRAQWQFACRAGTTTRYNNGSDDVETVSDIAWHKNNIGETNVHIVGLKEPNAWGFYDMHGNVMEFANDSMLSDNSSYLKTFYDGSEEWDPIGPSYVKLLNAVYGQTSRQRPCLGGSYRYEPGSCQTHDLVPCSGGANYSDAGARLWLPITLFACELK